jgi:hypothetical protein
MQASVRLADEELPMSLYALPSFDPSLDFSAPAPDLSAPAPDPLSDPDAIEELGDQIATLAAHLHAAEQRFLALVAEFDWRRGWELAGHRSCAHWLSSRTGFDLGTCREKVRTARKLAGLPETSAAMARGELSFSQVRALTRVATPDNETTLLELARHTATSRLEQMLRGWRRGTREEEADREQALHASRTLAVFPDDEGMYVVRGKLPAEVGALLMRAIEAAGDALYREERRSVLYREAGEPATGRSRSRSRSPEASERAAARRRADALGLLAERAMAAGFGKAASAGEGASAGEAVSAGKAVSAGEGVGTGDGVGPGRDGADTGTSGVCSDEGGSEAPISGTRAERYQVMLHVDAATLANAGPDAPEPGLSELEDGTRVSAETSRRLCCDASVVRLVRDPDGAILSVGRRTRTIPPSLRRALEARDRGCRFPGCGLRFTDAHHVEHWADGGETSLGNAVLLCRFHHRLVHEGGWQVRWWGKGRPVFFDPRGGTHFDGRWTDPRHKGAPDQAADGGTSTATPTTHAHAPEPDPVAALVADNHRRAANPDAWTAGTRWAREEDIPPEIYFPALEEIGEALA